MTYEELVLKVRDAYEDADARDIFEHIAVQVNVLGEAAGAFYVEVANRRVCVEPYDYYDRDGLFTVDTQVLLDIVDGKIPMEDAITSGRVQFTGNYDKVIKLLKIKWKKKRK